MSRTIDINSSSSSSSSNHVSRRSLELMIQLRGRQRPARRSLTRLSETICVDGHLIATRCRRISVSSTDHCVRAAAAAATIADFCRRVNNCRAPRVTGRRSFFLPVSALIGRHDNLRSDPLSPSLLRQSPYETPSPRNEFCFVIITRNFRYI